MGPKAHAATDAIRSAMETDEALSEHAAYALRLINPETE
jgi:hypothetical protein